MSVPSIPFVSLAGRHGLRLAMLAIFTSTALVAGAETPDGFATSEDKVLLRVQAIGDQIYECRAGEDGALAWAFREPLATLIEDGQTIGRHFVGPEWQLDDGSFVRAGIALKAQGDWSDDVAWLRLDVVDHGGEGRLSGTVAIERIATRGGTYAGACPAEGALHMEPYRADYVFYAG